MDKLEKCVKGLKHCTNSMYDCFDMEGCPYKGEERTDTAVCIDMLMKDTLELLGEYDYFCRFVATEMLDKMNDCGNCDSGEIFCRKLVKLGYMRLEDDVYSEVEHG